MKHLYLTLCAALFTCASTSYAQIGSCEESMATANLETGNVEAQIYNNGPLFWVGGRNKYEVPKGSGIQALFASNIAIGGFIDDELRMAGSTYGPYEFWSGPLDEAGNPPTNCAEFDHIWEIRDDDFVLYEQEKKFSNNMVNWPWHLGAPVVDGDGDPDNYNLAGGDRPELLGDQTLWWVMNDRGNAHEWSELNPIGLEVHVSAYGFDRLREIGEITFYRYRIINKNTSPLTQTFMGVWSDPDLGNASDDYFGSDSLLHLGYIYNDAVDERGYGEKPPAIGYTFLKTPEADKDLLDNDHDGQVDEEGEAASMHAAVTFIGGGGLSGDPANGTELYNYLQGLWQNGQPITVGQYGIAYSTIPTRFMYSGDPVTQSFWSELRPTEDENDSLPSSDKRFTISSGPFTILPEEEVEFLVAIVWTRGQDHLDSVRKLKNIVSLLQETPDSYLDSGYLPGRVDPLPGSPEQVLGFEQNFPNPFTGVTTIRYSLPKTMQIRLTVFDMLGREVAALVSGTREAGIYTQQFNGSNLAPGIYYARLEATHLSFTKKLVKLSAK